MPLATPATKLVFAPLPTRMCNATGNKANRLFTHKNVMLVCILN